MYKNNLEWGPRGLYHPAFEHDNCGIGSVVDIQGRQSHDIVRKALTIVETLEHRAGKDAEGKTGDGVGILLQVSHSFFQKAAAAEGICLGGEREYGVGMFFFPQDQQRRCRDQKLFETAVREEGMAFLGWREVPVSPAVLGTKAREQMPFIVQGFVGKPQGTAKGLDFDRRLYVARRLFEQRSDDTYVVSLSSRTVVYKGMFLVDQLRSFFPDLSDPAYRSAIAVVHSRFSTNTNPSWHRAHPNRLIVHNGEINTIRGNADRMEARVRSMSSPALQDSMDKVLPVISATGSDSAMLDNTLEFLTMSGMELPLAVMLLIPEPWEKAPGISRSKRDFYQYHATMMEPWDGPASIIFSDGDLMGAVLDRNGLRPSRYCITKDGQLILTSEVGALDIPPEEIVLKDRLRPGKMLLIDTVAGKLVEDDALKERYAGRQPFGKWVDRHLVHLRDLPVPKEDEEAANPAARTRLQQAFGYTYEDVQTSILPMARTGGEPIASMGIDSPIPALSGKPQPLFHYFKQLFAQVTNPPIDTIREEVITSTAVYLGSEGSLLTEAEDNCRSLRINNPILTGTDLAKIRGLDTQGLRAVTIPILYSRSTSLEQALDRLFLEVEGAHEGGANILILSDRGVDEDHLAIPSLLAVSALEQHLIRTKKRTAVSVVLESGEPREVHHFATLLGYGAFAVHPYLAHESIRGLIDDGMLNMDYREAVERYNSAVLHGVVKIASKMGISTIQSYQSAQIFEAVGIDKGVIDRYFTNTVSRVGGITLEDLEEQVEALHAKAFDPLAPAALEHAGTHRYRSGGEEHLYNPATIQLLQQAVRTGDYALFKEYAASLNGENRAMHLRGLLEFAGSDNAIPLDQVEPVDSIVTRFKTGAMSYGSISQEAHETLALAMNALGGKSNSGEGGESPDRMEIGPDGLDRGSAIKQVASGRFGVTSRYLVSAREIQIKMAQGAKPGEGGHLPGGKVYPWIAKTRHSTPGVGLISPPPHHDIYSIEDLAQLIYDLKNANRDAGISVKLASETGVGTIAAGVAKAGAQVVLISGYDGGTGAAPRSSIYNAGLPWELGLAEAHQTLIQNGLRRRVRLEADGKLMTGRDVAVAAMLGAEEFGFATAPLVALGCVMMRVCNLDTCPVGIATQNPELRKRFRGKPEHVVNFMRFVAEELREIMAALGIPTVEELVGRTDLLRMGSRADGKAARLDLSAILCRQEAEIHQVTFQPEAAYDFALEDTLDVRVLLPAFAGNLKTGQPGRVSLEIGNTNRTLGTILGSEITRQLGDFLGEDTLRVDCTGSGGQSFGAFIPRGLTMTLSGDSNDYFGKGLSGGVLALSPPEGAAFRAADNIIVGNVALYGATSGKAFIAGVAGERFCVRNSGALAVVEGVGDHGCEYMTGGRVVVLGGTGKNFAAGMSGGVAYLLDETGDLPLRVNTELVSLETLSPEDAGELKALLAEHRQRTGSEKAAAILEDFATWLPRFKKVLPHDYSAMEAAIAHMTALGHNAEQARMEAFYAVKGKKRRSS